MNCTIPGPNIKILGRAIHSLAKIGEDLYVESTEKELFFRTVNLSQTAYASYSFCSAFFSYFNVDPNWKNDRITCQVLMRCALSVFKSPLTLDKTTDSVEIKIEPEKDKIIFTVNSKKDIIKIFEVPVIECEALQAYYHKDKLCNCVTFQPKVVNEILTNFQNNLDEITWKVTKTNIVIKNYAEAEDDCIGIRTELCADMDEFADYKIDKETEITFCVKELRAILLFSDSVDLPLTAKFSVCSKPIVFIVKNEIIEVNMVMSTLSGPNNSSQNSNQAKLQSNSKIQNNLTAQEDLKNQSSAVVNGNCEVNEDLSKVSGADNTMSRTGRHKLKQVFQRCFEKETFNLESIPGYDVVLAVDSDSEAST